MQQKIVIECIFDFGNDLEAYEAFKTVAVNNAVRIQASMLMISSGNNQPQVICYSDDFMVGRSKIDLMAHKVNSMKSAPVNSDEQEDISDEMMEALSASGKR